MDKNRISKLVKIFFVIYYSVGVTGLTLTATRELFISLMPLSLLLSSAILLLFHRHWRKTHVIVFISIAIAGYLIEVLGVHTGQIFGSYSYGRALGFQIAGTPLLIGLNWLMLTYCVYAILEDTKLFWPIKALTASALMVLYDIAMEPVAIRLDMWSWGGPIPLQNYQAWFIISMIFLTVMHLFRIQVKNRIAAWLFSIQFAFFILLNITLRFF
ncbi:MAG: carotenoid biosynthesis protein [Bacteroidia bacterium]|nr:MAG: carotenoid biosynthesis protein [Bacteroidia bacterium]